MLSTKNEEKQLKANEIQLGYASAAGNAHLQRSGHFPIQNLEKI